MINRLNLQPASEPGDETVAVFGSGPGSPSHAIASGIAASEDAEKQATVTKYVAAAMTRETAILSEIDAAMTEAAADIAGGLDINVDQGQSKGAERQRIVVPEFIASRERPGSRRYRRPPILTAPPSARTETPSALRHLSVA